MQVKPFSAVRPNPKFVSVLNVPPYDVVTTSEVKKASHNNSFSFFHVTRAEADIENLADEHSQQVYDKARENFLKLITDGILLREEKPCYYLLEQTWRGRTQTGIYAAVSCEEYLDNQIKKHELTRKDKEEDRTNHILTTRADTGPVFLAFHGNEKFTALTEAVKIDVPVYHFTDENDVDLRFWVISDNDSVQSIEDFFKLVPALYIADGHHRAASAVNVWNRVDRKNPENAGASRFLAVLFPDDQLAILPYNRAVLDLNGLSEAAYLEKIKNSFTVESADSLETLKKGDIRMYLNKKIYKLSPKPGTYDGSSPLESLDVSVLQKNILSPVLGIDDPRTSRRIQFVGGIKGTAELMRLVDKNEAVVSFSLYPVSMAELMSITDRKELMPPKSTWFEPKLRDGLATYTF